MGRSKVQIELYQTALEEGAVVCALALRGGYTVKRYLLDGESFLSSNAFFNVLFNYYQLQECSESFSFDVQKSESMIAFSTSGERLIADLRGLFALLSGRDFSEDRFAEAKEKTRTGFADQYKNETFRTSLKLAEATELNSRFSLPELIRDVEDIDFDTFTESAEKLLVPGNMCLCITGLPEDVDVDQLTRSTEALSSLGEWTVRTDGAIFDPYLRQDAHVLNLGRSRVRMLAEIFSFLNPETSNFTKKLIMDLLAEGLPVREAFVSVHPLNSSIVFQTDGLDSFRDRLQIPDEETFALLKKRLLGKYGAMLTTCPKLFAMLSAQCMLSGIYMDQYLAFLDGCTCEMFAEICQKANYLITEAEVVLVQGRKKL